MARDQARADADPDSDGALVGEQDAVDRLVGKPADGLEKAPARLPSADARAHRR